MKQWDGDHALIYQNSGTDLNPQWSDFRISELDRGYRLNLFQRVLAFVLFLKAPT